MLAIPFIRINGIVPQTKKAIAEALEAVPDYFVFLQDTPSGSQKVTYLKDLKPGESIAFTDGAGKFYGKITKPMAGDGYLLDAKL